MRTIQVNLNAENPNPNRAYVRIQPTTEGSEPDLLIIVEAVTDQAWPRAMELLRFAVDLAERGTDR